MVGKNSQSDTESIQLRRAGQPISNLLDSLGRGLRETRLTAILGLLVAEIPDEFRTLFNMKGTVQSVSVEHHHDNGRSDILIESTGNTVVVEAKVKATDPIDQAAKYPGTHRVLLTPYRPTSKRSSMRTVSYVTWATLGTTLRRIAKGRHSPQQFVSRELVSYLENHHMIRPENQIDVYAREIANRETLELFLNAQLYTCTYEAGSNVAEARYFVPHFGHDLVQECPGIHYGVSYVAQIESVQVFETRKDLKALLHEHRSKVWLNKYTSTIDAVEGLRGSEHRTALLLGEPRLVFNPPIQKKNLQRGTGWLSKRFWSFDQLFKAWAGEPVFDEDP